MMAFAGMLGPMAKAPRARAPSCAPSRAPSRAPARNGPDAGPSGVAKAAVVVGLFAFGWWAFNRVL